MSRLVATQPALLEMSPNTVKARLVSVRAEKVREGGSPLVGTTVLFAELDVWV